MKFLKKKKILFFRISLLLAFSILGGFLISYYTFPYGHLVKVSYAQESCPAGSNDPSCDSSSTVSGEPAPNTDSVTDGGGVISTPPPDCPGGFTCTTAENSCYMTNVGCTYDNFVHCSAEIPSNDLCPSAPATVCTASCGACSVSCGGGTQTCTASDCSTYLQSCNTQVCIPLPTVSFSANPSSITSGNSSTLTWTSENTTSCSLINLSTNSSIVVSPTTTTDYTLQCTGPGGSAERSVNVTVNNPLSINVSNDVLASQIFHIFSPLSWVASMANMANYKILAVGDEPFGVWISANPTTIRRGQSTTLSWGSSNSNFCHITTPEGPNFYNQGTSGSIVVSPNSTRRYYATCLRYEGDQWAYMTPDGVLITVLDPLPTASLSANPTSIPLGNSSTLTWSSTNATTCSIDQDVDTGGATSGKKTVSPTATTNYTLTCTGPGGSTPASATVTVTAPLPTVSFSANPTSISSGQSSTLTWTSENTTSCNLVNLSTNSSIVVSPITTTDYTMQCTGAGGSASASATVTVTALPLPGDFSSSLGGQVTCNSAPFSWTVSSNAIGYYVDIAKSQSDLDNQTGTFENRDAGNNTSYTWNGLSESTTYYWRVWAYNASGGIHSYPTPPTFSTPYCNNPPSATNLQVIQPDYSLVGWASAIFSWTFFDPDPGDYQSAYRVQVDNNSDFSSPEVDSEKVVSSSNSFAAQAGQISFNNTYYWRLMVWDSKDLASSWISGPSFATPIHAYPSIDFTWTPQNPTVDESAQFTDQSTVYGGATKSSWYWTFQDSSPSFSTLQNPLIKFLSTGAKSVTLKVTDSDGFNSTGQKTLNILLKLPDWIEIPPF